MWKSQERVKKLDAMVKKRNLPEREQLVFQLQELQEELKNEQEKTTVRRNDNKELLFFLYIFRN